MSRIGAFAVVLLASGLMPGCSQPTLTDASSDPDLKHLVGTRYEVVGDVSAYGYREHSKAPVSHVLLIPPPAIAGPELGFKVPVTRGTKVTVSRVMSFHRLFNCGISLVVTLEGTVIPVTAPVRVDMSGGNQGDRCDELNPAIYRKLPGQS